MLSHSYHSNNIKERESNKENIYKVIDIPWYHGILLLLMNLTLTATMTTTRVRDVEQLKHNSKEQK